MLTGDNWMIARSLRHSTVKAFTYWMHVFVQKHILLLIGHKYFFTQNANIRLRKINPFIFNFYTANKRINQHHDGCQALYLCPSAQNTV